MFLKLDKQGSLYDQIARAISKEILEGRIAAGSKLPSTRTLANMLEVSRKSVIQAYELLCVEELAIARAGSGTRVVPLSARPKALAAKATTIGASAILKECVNAGLFCNDIHRDANNSLWLSQQGFVIDSLANVGALQTRGIDVTWSTPWQGLDVTASWRYFSAMKLDQLSPQPNLSAFPNTVANGGISSTDAAIKAYNYLDLTAAIKIADKVTFRVGVNNVFDKDPPIIGGSNLPATFGNGNTFPQVYDALGRYVFGQIIAQF